MRGHVFFGARLLFAVSVAAMGIASSPASAVSIYVQTNLDSDLAGATFLDPDLQNPWGIARSAAGPWWLSDNGTDLSTVYNGAGVKRSPSPYVHIPGGAPTGIVSNPSASFILPNQSKASFIFSGEDGSISAWNGALPVDVNGHSTAVQMSLPIGGRVYKGLAIGNNGVGDFLYATDFVNGHVDVFDTNFTLVNSAGGFTDPTLPAGYAPFGIQNIGGNIYVTFAKQSGGADEVDGAGFGYVSEFDANGNFIKRVAGQGTLNAPWGLTLAPADFGRFSNDLLVGNFGDGTITALDPATDAIKGQLHDVNGLLSIDGLWGLDFGGGNANSGASNALYFTAGLNGEADGLFGTLTAATVPEPSSLALQGVGLLGLLGLRRRARK